MRNSYSGGTRYPLAVHTAAVELDVDILAALIVHVASVKIHRERAVFWKRHRSFGQRIDQSDSLPLIAAAVLAFSLVWSLSQPSEGVVIQSTDARLGPGYAYEPAYEGILHETTEFLWLETRDGWVHARLPDDSEAWIRETSCTKIR